MSDPHQVIADAVTALFVPGDRPDRYPKAYASGADVVIIDWEDAVAADHKDAARDAATQALADGTLRALVRINEPATPAGEDDLVALAALIDQTELLVRPSHGLLGVMIPKTAGAQDAAQVGARLGTTLPLVALIESALGVAEARAIAATPGVTRLAFGALDFALDVGSEPEAATGIVARAEVVIASRAAGLPAPLESPATELDDPAPVERTSRAARALGFGGRLCIHPRQLAPVRRGFAPTEADLAWARGIVAAADGASRVDGRMVDRPVLERARRLLARPT